jgi:hypothetical protein
MSVHPISPSTCNLSPAVQIFVTFYMGHFYWNLSRKFKFA